MINYDAILNNNEAQHVREIANNISAVSNKDGFLYLLEKIDILLPSSGVITSIGKVSQNSFISEVNIEQNIPKCISSKYLKYSNIHLPLFSSWLRNKLPQVSSIIDIRSEWVAAQDFIEHGFNTVVSNGVLHTPLAPSTYFCFFNIEDINSQKNKVMLQLLTPFLHIALLNAYTSEHAESVTQVYNMTTRESEIIQLIANGTTNKEIAAVLSISYLTVKNHIKNIYTKLGVNNRYDAIHKIMQLTTLKCI